MCEVTDSRCTTTVAVRGTRLNVSGLSRFLLPTLLCGRQRKVGAAPHRGNTNRPLTTQGKPNPQVKQTKPPNRQQPTTNNQLANISVFQPLRPELRRTMIQSDRIPCGWEKNHGELPK